MEVKLENTTGLEHRGEKDAKERQPDNPWEVCTEIKEYCRGIEAFRGEKLISVTYKGPQSHSVRGIYVREREGGKGW